MSLTCLVSCCYFPFQNKGTTYLWDLMSYSYNRRKTRLRLKSTCAPVEVREAETRDCTPAL